MIGKAMSKASDLAEKELTRFKSGEADKCTYGLKMTDL